MVGRGYRGVPLYGCQTGKFASFDSCAAPVRVLQIIVFPLIGCPDPPFSDFPAEMEKPTRAGEPPAFFLFPMVGGYPPAP